MSLLEVKSLSFAFDEKPVFENVSFTVEQGQIFCLVGPNGCGKTTLEHCILMHLKPQEGQILLDGEDINAFSTREFAAEVAYVPQTHVRSFPYRTVDVVAMGRTRQQKLLDSNTGHVEHALKTMEQLGIGHLAEIEYTTLSGGELQMALIARALTQESRVLVLDEPTAHLDVKKTQDVLYLLAKLAKDHGKTVVLSTHEFNHPLMLQDEGVDVKMALMESGHLSDVDSPLKLLSSGCLSEIYKVRSQVVEIATDPIRHYLAVWSDGIER